MVTGERKWGNLFCVGLCEKSTEMTKLFLPWGRECQRHIRGETALLPMGLSHYTDNLGRKGHNWVPLEHFSWE